MTRTRSLISLLLVAAAFTPAAADRGRHGGGRRWHSQPQPAPLVDFAALRQITSACQDAFEGQANEQACVATVTRGSQRFDASASIRACEDAYEGDANELACLAVAVDAWQDPVPVIRACEDAFEGDANELACTQTVAQSWLAVGAVPACEAAFDGDANEQSCLATLVGTRYDVAQLVSYCEDSYDGDANELWCLGQFR
ncbi:MAG TPA: hypothetical protein VL326_31805 [Kofleriaceae bacterium]|nr:hypothetical protein [Kofleriaceae bacterium]